jgi:asparagine synthase (glutamine-hydrolysing)
LGKKERKRAMCGICGKIFFEAGRYVDPKLVKRMVDSMHHRGPDDERVYVSRNAGLGHRRLSIIGIDGEAAYLERE